MGYVRRSPDHTELVRRIAEQFPREWEAARKRPDGSRDDAFIRRFAWEASRVDPHIGLNGKRGSAVVSTDAVSYRNETGPGGVEVIDIIVGATHSPSWQDATIPVGHPEHPGGVLGRYIAPSDPGGGPPAPPPLGELESRLRALEARLEALEGRPLDREELRRAVAAELRGRAVTVEVSATGRGFLSHSHAATGRIE